MPSAPVSLDELKRLTREHWNRNDTEWYIDNLLEHEMQHAQQQVEEYDTLALLIGFSPDPLLQTIWKYRPQRIVLVLNHSYGDQKGKPRANEYVEWIGQMESKDFCSSSAYVRLRQEVNRREDIAVATSEAQPDWVFRELRDRLLPDQQDGKRIVVDITGAKKNMASGAFLFAAYVGADISYVDFEEYDPVKRRPLGYTCRIGTQPNPYLILGLRDWERVQKLFEQFAFESAAVEVERLLNDMDVGLPDAAGAGSYFSLEQRQAVARLASVLSVLDEWDNGDYTAAWNQWRLAGKDGGQSLRNQMPNFPLPHAIQYLGERNWPSAASAEKTLLQQHKELKRGSQKPEDSIFNRPDLLLIYACDERDKIHRLIRYQNDYRSAFLRSAGLDELLLKARVVVLWLTDRLLLAGKPRADFSDEQLMLRFKGLADCPSADNLRDFLRNVNRRNREDPAILRVAYWVDNRRRDVNLSRKVSSDTIMKKYWEPPECTIDHETLVDLRGEAIHTHLSIPISYATAAYYIADYALRDFMDNWVTLLGKHGPAHQSWQLSWVDLCVECRLDFLPALPTLKEQAT